MLYIYMLYMLYTLYIIVICVICYMLYMLYIIIYVIMYVIYIIYKVYIHKIYFPACLSAKVFSLVTFSCIHLATTVSIPTPLCWLGGE